MTRHSVREEVRRAYSEISEEPAADAPFCTGRKLAEDLGYPDGLLNGLPGPSVEAFCGVSNVSLWADLSEGQTVLDLGCGAGVDTLIAARRVGPKGAVIGVDFSSSMLKRAEEAITAAGYRNVSLCPGDAERIPVADCSVDAVMINGIFNLNPARCQIFEELGRVVRPGGSVCASEIVLNEPLTMEERTSPTNWFT